MSKHEAGMLAALMANHTESVYPEIANHSGCIVKMMGDGALVSEVQVKGDLIARGYDE
jgi:class 3 adenylate cyclase